MPSALSTWTALGTPAPAALTDARLQLHWAVQIIAAVPFNYREPVPDDSHTNVDWEPEAGRFVARPVGPAGAVAALTVHDLVLAVLVDGRVQDERPLNGATLDDGYRWMGDAVARSCGGDARPGALARRDYEMPAHGVGAGAAFTAGGSAALAELARWYLNARLVLESVRSGHERASEVRTWPHHFDMATLLTLDDARSITAGLSPGDDAYDEPYLYVTPSPAPAGELPRLRSDGVWHRDGFTAAVLTGSRIAVGSAAEQAARAERFLTAALEVSRSVLGDGRQ